MNLGMVAGHNFEKNDMFAHTPTGTKETILATSLFISSQNQGEFDVIQRCLRI